MCYEFIKLQMYKKVVKMTGSFSNNTSAGIQGKTGNQSGKTRTVWADEKFSSYHIIFLHLQAFGFPSLEAP